MSKYQVLNDNMCDFTTSIERLIAEGFKPVGGVAVDSNGVLYQAMMKKTVAIPLTPQPIETAPTNKKIMAFNPVTGWYFTKYDHDGWPMHGWVDSDVKIGIWFPSPTHWMPEPEYIK